MNDSVVVYFYSDPAYRGDLTSAVKTLKERGFRVVKGDNADELLFLLQVGRPAAVIYTLASGDARSSAAYQMVSRRALDLLVPVFLVGPEDPRDGVVLVTPVGGGASESHVPFHSLGDLIARFHVNPPSTPSRPPDVLHTQTVGKGRTLHNWNGAGSIAPQDPRAGGSIAPKDPRKKKVQKTLMGVPAPVDVASRETIPGKPLVSKKTEQMIINQPTEPPPAPAPAPITIPSSAIAMGATLEMPGVQPVDRGLEVESSQPDGQENTGDLPVYPPDPFKERAGPDVGRKETAAKGKTGSLVIRIGVVASAIIVLAAVSVVLYLATRPSGSAPEPLPMDASQFPNKGVAPRDISSPGSSAAGDMVQRPPRKVDPVEEPGEIQSAVPDGDDAQPTSAVKQRDKVRPPLERTANGAFLFPGHFREETATFWFLDDEEESSFLAKLESSDGEIHLLGRPTHGEVQNGRGALGLSRAWAVEKYLVRKGVDPERIVTERGTPVDVRDDIDERGWARNRWVDVSFR